jgi:uncharacterized protein with PIN domain
MIVDTSALIAILRDEAVSCAYAHEVLKVSLDRYWRKAKLTWAKNDDGSHGDAPVYGS